MALESRGWNRLPYHILVDICSYLKVCDRNSFGRVCKEFNEIIHNKHIWRRFQFCLTSPADERFLTCLDKYGHYMHHIDIELDQSEAGNRNNAIRILTGLGSLKELRLKHLSVRFKGENPCFYSGKEFLDALWKLLGPTPAGQVKVCPLLELDLGEMSVSLDAKFLDLISENNPSLQKLNIQNNKVLVLNVAPPAVLRLADRCRHLTDLQLFSHSLTDEVLLRFAEPGRRPLSHLSVMHRGRGAVFKSLASDTWRTLTSACPRLKVSLLFDHTCPTDHVAAVMRAEIPVSTLLMETYTYIYQEVHQAAISYRRTLERFVLHTPLSRNSPELHAALVQLARNCEHLEEIRVYCVLDAPTVEKILELRPRIAESGRYTLRHEAWVVSGERAPVTGRSDVC